MASPRRDTAVCSCAAVGDRWLHAAAFDAWPVWTPAGQPRLWGHAGPSQPGGCRLSPSAHRYNEHVYPQGRMHLDLAVPCRIVDTCTNIHVKPEQPQIRKLGNCRL